MIYLQAIHISVLMFAWLAPPPEGEALRSGCSLDDRQIGLLGADDPIQVNQALAGYSQTCYKVTTQGKTGYVLGETLPAIAAFVHKQQEYGAAALEAQARLLAAPPPPKPTADDKDKSKPSAPEVPEVFESFSGRDLNGKAVSLAGMRSRVTLVTFWSPKNAASQGQQLSLMPLYHQFSRADLSVVGISTDPNPTHIKEALDDVTLGWPQIGDTSGLAKRYKVDPKAGTTFLLDADHRIVGTGLKGPALENKIRELLAAR